MTAKKIARYATAAAMDWRQYRPMLAMARVPGEFSANIGIFSDYHFRGTSQTGEDPAIQGGIDYSLNTGIQDTSVYVGVWGSNVDFNDGDEAQVELDVYGGFAGTIEGVDWQLGALGYLYPGASSSLNYDYVEVAASLGYTFYDLVTVGIGYNYSPTISAASGDGHYLQGTVSTSPLPESKERRFRPIHRRSCRPPVGRRQRDVWCARLPDMVHRSVRQL
ncbi:MAG: TorF family putative porin [Rhodospirillales bacterium]|nr:TorF family putative porin [Rhodospirillales bacterium]